MNGSCGCKIEHKQKRIAVQIHEVILINTQLLSREKAVNSFNTIALLKHGHGLLGIISMSVLPPDQKTTKRLAQEKKHPVKSINPLISVSYPVFFLRVLVFLWFFDLVAKQTWL